MDKSKKQTTGLLETASLVSVLPEKPVEQRPKYVQILQQEKNAKSLQVTPSKSPIASLGANTTLNTPPVIEMPMSVDPKKAFPSNPTAGTGKKPFRKNNNYKGNRGLVLTPKQTNDRPPIKVFLKRQEVVALPFEMKIRELPISSDNVVYFSGPSNYLSALFPVKIMVDGNEYNSVEHYYQACKLYILVGEGVAADLKLSATPIEVKKATKDILKEKKVPPHKINEWKEKDSVGVLRHVIHQKFLQNEVLKEKLLATGDKILIQTYIGDTYFAVGAGAKYTSIWVTRHTNQSIKVPETISADNVKYLPLIANGKNALGWILMSVRDEIRANSA